MAERERQAGIAVNEERKYLDVRTNVGADIVHNLNELPLPIPDQQFDEIIAYHVLEHIREFYPLMDELHRILKTGGILHVVVPHHTDWTFWRDPGHITHFNSYSFDRFQAVHGHHFDTPFPFIIKKQKIHLQKIWRYIGFEFLLNLSFKVRALRFVRKIWESQLCFMIRGVTIHVDLETAAAVTEN
jgi:SAM-dependent methyltransferase